MQYFKPVGENKYNGRMPSTIYFEPVREKKRKGLMTSTIIGFGVGMVLSYMLLRAIGLWFLHHAILKDN